LLKTLLLDYCTKTSTDFHPGFPVTFFFLFLFLHYYSVAFCQLYFYNKDWIGLDWISNITEVISMTVPQIKAPVTSKIKHAIKLAIKLKIIAATTSSCNKSCRTCTTVAALISIIFLAANDGVPSV